MEKKLWFNFLEEINNLQMFALCNEFDALSLEDIGSSSSSSRSTSIDNNLSYRERFLHCCRSSPMSMSISLLLRAPFLEMPRSFLESFRSQSDNLRLCFAFRFRPGQDTFLHDELQLPKSFDRLTILSKSLGLSLNKRALPTNLLYSWGCSGAGLRGLVNEETISKILVEVITYSNGFYGRFLVLVCLGIGCTVWYKFSPGTSDAVSDISGFTPIDSYEPFFYTEYSTPDFQRISFVESRDVSASVESAFRDHPFEGISIPASGPVLKAVGLGLMVAIFLAVDIVPDISSATVIG